MTSRGSSETKNQASSNSNNRRLEVVIDLQQCLCYEHNRLIRELPVSTAQQGTGQQQGSHQTPLGKHIVRAKIGTGQPIDTVFVGRRPTGEIWNDQLHQQYPGRDWILTRILWLSGKEVGHNRLGAVDTMRRYIYFHGTPERNTLGRQPASHGCVRMASAEISWLFDWVVVGTEVNILKGKTL